MNRIWPRTVLLALALVGPATPKRVPRTPIPARPSGWKTIDLVSATCGDAAPGPVTFGLPPGYVIRTSAKGLTAGCLWGTPKDLAVVLGESEATFDRVEQGIFQARLTTTVGFDSQSGRFTDEEALPDLFGRAGVADLTVGRRTLARAPALVVSGRGPNGAPLRLLYLALPGSNVLLVNFHEAVSAAPDDESKWKRFLESIRAAR